MYYQINYNRTCLSLLKLSFPFIDQSSNSRLLFHSVLFNYKMLIEQQLTDFFPSAAHNETFYSRHLFSIGLLTHITLKININVWESVTPHLFTHNTSSTNILTKKQTFFFLPHYHSLAEVHPTQPPLYCQDPEEALCNTANSGNINMKLNPDFTLDKLQVMERISIGCPGEAEYLFQQCSNF